MAPLGLRLYPMARFIPFSTLLWPQKTYLSEFMGAKLVGMTHWMSGFFPKPNLSPPLNSWT